MTNPMLNERAFSAASVRDANAMTVNGTVQKTAGLLFLLLCSAAYTWTVTRIDGPAAAMPWAIGGLIAGFVMVLTMCFKAEWSPIVAPGYAIAEGLVLGAISNIFNARYHGIVFSAVGLTLGVLAVMLVLYRTGVVRATDRFKKIMFAAVGAIMIVYLCQMVLGMFGRQIPGIFSNGPVGIGFSLLVVGIASFRLVIDFDQIETFARNGAPRYMEWFAGCGVLITLVWVYLEILRLLAKLQSRRD